MWTINQFCIILDIWWNTLDSHYWYRLIQIPQIPNNLLVIIIAVLITILVSLILYLIVVFIIRLLEKRSTAKQKGSTKKTESPAKQMPSLSPSEPPGTAVVEIQPSESSKPTAWKLALGSGEMHSFTELPISIGRAQGNDLILDDETISGQHARIYYDGVIKEVCIADLDSLNGVFINDQPTRKNVIHDGTRIRLGGIHLVFHHASQTPSNG